MGFKANPMGFITRLLLVSTIFSFIFVSAISAQDSLVDNEKQESERFGKELGRRGMIATERIGIDAAGEQLGALGLNLESTGPGVFDALFSSFSMILVTEIGNETFIIAALMAMRHPKATVLSGALSALFVMTRCLPRDGLDEHNVIHMDGANILAVSYGSPGACPYPRQLKLPGKWSFNSHTILKSSEQAPRTPIFTEEILGSSENVEGEAEAPVERSFWAKYWMYLIPLGLIVMNAVTQATNMAEERPAGSQGQAPAAIQRDSGSAAPRRR